jgi:hypothetical protein
MYYSVTLKYNTSFLRLIRIVCIISVEQTIPNLSQGDCEKCDYCEQDAVGLQVFSSPATNRLSCKKN